MPKRKAVPGSSKIPKPKQQKSLASFFSSSSRTVAAVRNKSTNASKNIHDTCRYHIFLDLDGVLVDFQAGLKKIFPKYHEKSDKPNIPAKVMWREISKSTYFYRDLPWTTDGMKLWNTLKSCRPEILTGVSMAKSCRQQKFEWCSREFRKIEEKISINKGEKINLIMNHVDMVGSKRTHRLSNDASRLKRDEGVVNVITCWSKNKFFESGHNR